MEQVVVDRELEFDRKLAEASHRLRDAGIRPWNGKPPLHRLLVRCGVRSRPPHFVGFWGNVLVWGLHFAVAWGVLMWFAHWAQRGMPMLEATAIALAAGVFFGLSMGVYYRVSAARHRLPRWKHL